MLYVIKIIRNQEEREKRENAKFRKLQNGFLPAYPCQAQYNSVSYDFMFFKVKNNEDTIINGYKISITDKN